MCEIILNEDYWDCECEAFFIHPKGLKKCRECGAYADDQPDSRENEVEMLFDMYLAAGVIDSKGYGIN